MSEKNFKEENTIIQYDVENKQLIEENEKIESREAESRKKRK